MPDPSKRSSRSAGEENASASDRLDPRLFDALYVAPAGLLPDSFALEVEGDEYARLLESICGISDDSQPVEQYDGTLGVTRAFVDAHQAPAAQVQWNDDLATHYTNPGNVNGVRWGSGTMISPDLFLTCGHLFDQAGGGWTRPMVNGTSTVISPQEIATRMHLNFNYQVDASGTLRTETRFPITHLVEFRLGGIDMAICRIGGAPGNTFGFTPVATADVAVGAMLAIIGHPAGQPKRVEAGPATALTAGRLSYNDIDTLGGNSGSGIIGPAGTVVGVHTNGGCNPQGTGSNFGVPIMTIRAVSPTLQNLNTTGPVTTPARDVLTSARDDVINTLAFRDTSTVADQIMTNPRDDLATRAWLDTNRRLDVIQTSPLRDNIITGPLADRPPFNTGGAADSLQEHINPGQIDDPVVNPPVIRDPGINVGGLRPYVLQGGHRFGPEAGQPDAASREAFEATLAQYEEALAAAEHDLEVLKQEYTDLYVEYAETFGQQG